ncbi:MAG: L-rhamnose isomerase [Bacilli bacterium]|nr:L-rhamnose isomerase [Bacilli bacterium]
MRKEVKELYASYGVDAFEALRKLKETKISLHCWQLDDVKGFEGDGDLTGGIQTTGNYLGRARNFKELTADLDKALSYIPGSKKINLHAIYQTGKIVDRSEVGPEQFKEWVSYAKSRGLGLDYNPTIFSHPMLVDGLSLSSPDEKVRNYWIKHCINGLKITEMFGKELGQKSLMNIWIPDGLKDAPADRIGPRMRLKESLDKILAGYKYDKKVMDVSVESKVFGIGVESYTVGSNEFYLNYAASRNICCLLDTGHFHPTENVADKISSMYTFYNKLAFHVSRPVRWDSDHVLKLNDDLQDVADELVKCDGLKRSYIGLDYFDASINRIAALVIGARNMEKALLKALLTPWKLLKEAQDSYDHTKVLALQEEIKTLPWGEVWNEYLKRQNMVSDAKMFEEIKEYENKVLVNRK